ncbi:magnesium transporter [bacterium]|nr:magnesium transporter [bacterium]
MDSLIALIIGFGIGFGFYYFDLKKGFSSYRKWYKLTHKDPLPAESNKGWVFNQPFSARLSMALVLSLVLAVILFFTGNLNLIMILVYAAVVLVGCLVAFYLSPYLFNKVPGHLEKISKAIEKVDEIEERLKKEETASETAIKEEAKAKSEIEEPETKEEDQPEKKKDDKDDWRSGVKDFLDK